MKQPIDMQRGEKRRLADRRTPAKTPYTGPERRSGPRRSNWDEADPA